MHMPGSQQGAFSKGGFLLPGPVSWPVGAHLRDKRLQSADEAHGLCNGWRQHGPLRKAVSTALRQEVGRSALPPAEHLL